MNIVKIACFAVTSETILVVTFVIHMYSHGFYAKNIRVAVLRYSVLPFKLAFYV